METSAPKKDFKKYLKKYPPSTVLIQENELSRKMYIIVSGNARVYKTYLNKKIVLAVLKENDFFGELSFLDSAPRSASVETLTELVAYEVNANDVMDELDNLPPWFIPILKGVLSRFRITDEHLTTYQAMHLSEQKLFNKNSFYEAIYGDIYRIVKTLLLIYNEKIKTDKKDSLNIVSPTALENDLLTLVGQSKLPFRTVWKKLDDFEFYSIIQQNNSIVLDTELLTKFENYLNKHITSNTFIIYSQIAVKVLNCLDMKASDPKTHVPNSPTTRILAVPEIDILDANAMKQAIDELQKDDVVKLVKKELNPGYPLDVVEYDLLKVKELSQFQSFLKAFDHTMLA